MKIFAAQLNMGGDSCVNRKLERAASWKVTDERIQTCSIDCQWEKNHHSAMHTALQPLALPKLNISASPPVAWSFLLVQLFLQYKEHFFQKMTVSKHVDGQPSALLTREENQAKLDQQLLLRSCQQQVIPRNVYSISLSFDNYVGWAIKCQLNISLLLFSSRDNHHLHQHHDDHCG